MIRKVRLHVHEFTTDVPHGRRELDAYITLAWHGGQGVLDPKWTLNSTEGHKKGETR
jgi:hypothetical protein